MPLYNKPVRLERLSLDAFGNYVTGLSERLVKSTIACKEKPHCLLFFKWFKRVNCYSRALRDEDPSVDVSHAQEVCRILQHTIQAAVDRKLANKITSELLKNLDFSDSYHFVDSPLCDRILQELVCASMHADLTDLDIAYRRIASFVVSRLWTLGKLKRLKITCWRENEAWLEDMTKYMHTFHHLEVFSFKINCTDDVLKILCRSCRYLRCLDVSGSHSVTDDSVPSFLGLTCLQKLNLICTEISEEGLLDLINGLAHMAVYIRQPCYIKNFGCDCYSDTQLRTLVTGLINVREVSLRMCDVSATVSVLKHLEYLRVLRLKYCFFSDVTDLLLTSGYQLLELELEDSGNLDLKVISENCPTLVKLVVKGGTFGYKNCCSFPKLQHLTLQTRDTSVVASLLSQCLSLTTLQLCTLQEFYKCHLASVLKRNPFEHLLTLSVGTLSGCVSPETVGIVSQHCSKLSELKVFGEPGADMKPMCHLYPGLQVDPDLWSQLVDKEAIYNAGLAMDLL
jgi:hypothetical protein